MNGWQVWEHESVVVACGRSTVVAGLVTAVCVVGVAGAEVATGELGPTFAVPITGHSRFGNGYGIAARLSYEPTAKWSPFALNVEGDYSCTDIWGMTKCWGRALAGAQAMLAKRDHIEFTVYVLAGADYIGGDKLGVAGLLGVGPRYVSGHFVAGVSVDLLYSYVHGEDTENGNFPDPTGTLLRVQASIGASW